MSNYSHREKTINKIKIANNLPLCYSIPISFKNTYSSKSERERHLKLLSIINQIKHMSMIDPENEMTILKEFLEKNDIHDPYYNEHYLYKLSKCIKNDICLDPNKSIKENLLLILHNPNIENDYKSFVSPLALLTKNQSNLTTKRSRNKKYMILPHITKRDPYSIISLNRQKSFLGPIKDQSIVKIEEELDKELSLYHLKCNNGKNRIVFNKSIDNDSINQKIKNQLYITQNQSNNEIKQLDENDQIDSALKKSKSNQNIKVREIFTRLSNYLPNTKSNRFNLMKKRMKLTEYILHEKTKKRNALDNYMKKINISTGELI